VDLEREIQYAQLKRMNENEQKSIPPQVFPWKEGLKDENAKDLLAENKHKD
jgi:hypothetical protein